jgi:hypothetical protein
MPITVGLPLERDEYDMLAGILKMNSMKVAPTLADCLREKAASLKAQTSALLESSDADSVRPNVHTDNDDAAPDAEGGPALSDTNERWGTP